MFFFSGIILPNLFGTISLLISLIVFQGCKDSINPQLNGAALVELNIVVEEGVKGTHKTGSTFHAAGTKISYDFTSMSGFDSAHVLRMAGDEIEYLPQSGIITLSKSTSLLVGADSLSSVDTETIDTGAEEISESLLNEIQSAILSENWEELTEFILHSTKDSTDRRLFWEVVNRLKRDSTASKLIARLEDKLSGKFVEISSFNTSVYTDTNTNADEDIQKNINTNKAGSNADIRKNIKPISYLPGEPTTILHINGILTDPVSALGNASEISNLMQRTRWDYSFPHRVVLLYNPSSRHDSTKQQQSIYECFAKLTELRGLSTVTIPIRLAKCTGKTIKQVLSRYDDLREAAVQFFHLQMRIHSLNDISLAAVDTINSWRNWGQHVLVIPHSQGNMMTQEAIFELIRRKHLTPPLDTTCLMVIPTAAPMSSHWKMHESRIAGISAKGDLILNLSTNSFDQISTRFYEEETAKIEKLKTNNENIYYIKKLLLGLKMHGFQSGYMAHKEVTDKIASAISQTYEQCALGGIAVSPSYSNIAINSTITAVTTLLNLRGKKLLGNRSVSWTEQHIAKNPAAKLLFANEDMHRHYPSIKTLNEGHSLFTARAGPFSTSISIDSYLPGDSYYSMVFGLSSKLLPPKQEPPI